MDKDYSLINEIKEIMNEKSYDDDKVEASLAAIGESLGLAYIAVKEVISENHILCCTYEWNRKGKHRLLNGEARFPDDVWEQWLNGYGSKSHRIWTWNMNEGTPCPLKLVIKE